MTPKETAISLYEKYRIRDGYNLPKWVALECAIIVCGTHIELLNQFADYWDLKNGEWYRDEMLRLNEVKKQIELL